MSDNTIELRDDEINVEEIMHTIRENVRKRKESAQFHKQSVNEKDIEPEIQKGIIIENSPLCDIESLNSSWDIRNNSYYISSHRPYLGKILIKGRQLVHSEVRRYVDPVIWKQSKFNEEVAQLFIQSQKKIFEIESTLSQIKNDSVHQENNLKQIIARLEEQNTNIFQQLEQIRLENANNYNRTNDLKMKISQVLENRLLESQEEVKNEIRKLLSELDLKTENQMHLINNLDTQFQSHLMGEGKIDTQSLNYFTFEEHFRGSRKSIKERQRRYLPFFEHCSNVLDIGCGRGEFLELLKEHDIGGIGIDTNKDMVEYCQSKGFDAKQTDALEYLNNLEDTDLDGIFSDQVIEHLHPNYLIRLLPLAYQKLKSESHIVLGTVNILNPGGLANFFVDPTHISPIHPEYLKYCLEDTGFYDIQIIYRTYDEKEIDKNPADLRLIAADYIMVGKK
jgi:SAM-dependent methyltransferase